MLLDDRAARYLAEHQVGFYLADGRMVFVQPPDRWIVRLMKRLRAAFSGRGKPVDAEAIVG
jgi:hypothetical protein